MNVQQLSASALAYPVVVGNAGPNNFKSKIVDALWQVVDAHDCVLSGTLAGSFLNSNSLDGLSDIDFIVIVDELDRERFERLTHEFSNAVSAVMAEHGYRFRLNSTLGPLKFNEPKLAVLHLMLYSRQGHIDHVIKSPFTCLDWQQSSAYRKQAMADVYPTHTLQPHHFLSARRSVLEYLNDYNKREISYRELSFENDEYCEIKRAKPMDNRDRHEFAYHVMRFLMMNLLKLVNRKSSAPAYLEQLMAEFFVHFPDDQQDAASLLMELSDKKKRLAYHSEIKHLDARLRAFVENFQRQFQDAFVVNATRHVMFRHAATELNRGELRFVGHTDPNIVQEAIDPNTLAQLRSSIDQCAPQAFFTSPLARCRQSLAVVSGDCEPTVDDRLKEINYGECDTMRVAEAHKSHPELFDAWQRGEDPRFPAGENSSDVLERALSFIGNHWSLDDCNSVCCSHNVVLRELVGHTMRINPSQRYRIQVPHLVPIEFVYSKKYGLFIDLSQESERALLKNFATK